MDTHKHKQTFSPECFICSRLLSPLEAWKRLALIYCSGLPAPIATFEMTKRKKETTPKEKSSHVTWLWVLLYKHTHTHTRAHKTHTHTHTHSITK